MSIQSVHARGNADHFLKTLVLKIKEVVDAECNITAETRYRGVFTYPRGKAFSGFSCPVGGHACVIVLQAVSVKEGTDAADSSELGD